MNEISRLISNYRAENRLTLEEFGKKVGVGKSTVKKWESGNVENIRRDKLVLIAKVLGVSPSYLMGWEQQTIFDVVDIPEPIEETPKNIFVPEALYPMFNTPNVYMDNSVAKKYDQLSEKAILEVYEFINNIWKRESIAKLKAEIAAKEAELKKMEEGN